MLDQNIHRFKRKFYLNRLLRGSILAGGLLLGSFLFVTAVEYFGNFDTPLRATLFYSFLLTAGTALAIGVLEPISRILMPKRQLSDHEAARRIGQYFPQIQDKLLNALQLMQASQGSAELIRASILQKSSDLSQYQFAEAIDLSDNRRYLKYLLIPLLLILGIGLYRSDIFTQTTTRLIQYDRKFAPQAPFQFRLGQAELSAFKDEDFTLELHTEGRQIPAKVTVVTADGRKLKMVSEQAGVFQYTFKKLQQDVDFYFEASGFHSQSHTLRVIPRPSLRGFSVYLDYPAYVGKTDERLNNTGNLLVPEGTRITWQFQAQEAERVEMRFALEEAALPAEPKSGNAFEVAKTARASDHYEVRLQNAFTENKEQISYYLNVAKDEHPSIALRQVQDTVLFDYLLFGGNIGDDYGITGLNLRYQVLREGQQPKPDAYQTLSIPFNRDIINQSFFHKIAVADLKLQQGQYVSYFVEVWDNDGVNGRKRSKTGEYQFKIPTQGELNERVASSAEQAESQIEEVLEDAHKLDKKLQEVQDRLKGKKELDWQDKKALEELMEQRKALEEKLAEMQKSQQALQEQFQKFNETSPELVEKAEQLQQLMDEVLDEETRELYRKLEELMQQNALDEQLMEQLEQLDMSQEMMEMELERSLELFKRLKFDMQLEQVAKDLERLAEQQEELAKESEKASPEDAERLKQEQEQLNKEFEKTQQGMEQLQKMNEDLMHPNDLQDAPEQMQDIEKQMQEGQQQLGEQQPKKASKAQQRAAEQMQQLAQQMQQMQQSAEMEQLNEDYDALRQILENLLKLSFDQERLMGEFKALRRGNPKFVPLGQEQLKLQADAKIIEDSLVALSKRVFQIESFVTRELASMNGYMARSLEVIRQRPPDVGPATAKEQQHTMTAVNNLALLLNDILKQMQQQMSSGMAGQQMNEQNGNAPSMSQLQQMLNQQIEQLQKSGKSGRQLSEELAKLAAQQEMIRRALQQARQGQKQQGGGGQQDGGRNPGEEGGEGGQPGGDGEQHQGGKKGGQGDGGTEALERLMEQTERDLVNKRLTAQTLQRQKEIMTRLLESEKAMRERERDNKREAETAREQRRRQSPDAFSEYLKQKAQQIELLKTIPPSLKPYYKQEVNEYFKKVGGGQ